MALKRAGVGRAGRMGLAVAFIATACDGGGDPGPMWGQQVLAGRDVGNVFFWKDRTLAFTRDTIDTSQPEPQDFLVWPLAEPEPSIALGGVDWTYPDRWPAWLVGDLLLTGTQYQRVYDVSSRQSADLFPRLHAPRRRAAPAVRGAGDDDDASGRAGVREGHARQRRHRGRRAAARSADVRDGQRHHHRRRHLRRIGSGDARQAEDRRHRR
jgi:hypothetical protein